MIAFDPYRPDDVADLVLQPAQAEMQAVLEDPYWREAVAVPGLSWTVRTNGAVVAAGGILPMTAARAMAWSWVGAVPRRDWWRAAKFARSALRMASGRGYARIEAVVKAGFDEGHRFARALGFVCETPEGMRGWGPAGDTYFLYARVPE